MNRLSLKAFTMITTLCGIPVAWEKTLKDPGMALVFYGAHLDMKTMQVSLPHDKLTDYRLTVEQALPKTKITVKQLQSLVGKLQFATCAIAGRSLFLRRLYDLLSHLADNPKPYWHVTINHPARKDLKTWLIFLHFNGISIICLPSVVHSNSLNLYTDASDFGFRACYGTRWLTGQWP